ncbi:hypothetical protein HKD37_10G028744 [Glycine soja]
MNSQDEATTLYFSSESEEAKKEESNKEIHPQEEGQPLMVKEECKEVNVSSKMLVKKKKHFKIKTNIKEISPLRQPPHFLLCKKTLVSIVTPLKLKFIPQVKELLDEDLVCKSLNPCALLVPKIGIIRHQIPMIGGTMNVLSGATLFCKITHAPKIFMICVHRDSLGAHMGHLRFVINFCRNNQHENKEKVIFYSITFLNFLNNDQGLSVDPKRIKVISEFVSYFSILVAPFIELVRNYVLSWEDGVEKRILKFQEPMDLRSNHFQGGGNNAITHLLFEVMSLLSLSSSFRYHTSSKKQRNPLMKKIVGLAPMKLTSNRVLT